MSYSVVKCDEILIIAAALNSVKQEKKISYKEYSHIMQIPAGFGVEL